LTNGEIAYTRKCSVT